MFSLLQRIRVIAIVVVAVGGSEFSEAQDAACMLGCDSIAFDCNEMSTPKCKSNISKLSKACFDMNTASLSMCQAECAGVLRTRDADKVDEMSETFRQFLAEDKICKEDDIVKKNPQKQVFTDLARTDSCDVSKIENVLGSCRILDWADISGAVTKRMTLDGRVLTVHMTDLDNRYKTQLEVPLDQIFVRRERSLRQIGLFCLGRVVKSVDPEDWRNWDSQISKSVIHGEPSFSEAFHAALCTAR